MRLKLFEDLSIAAAPAQRAALLDALTGREPLEIDASAVTAVDLAGLQLLCAAHRSAAAAAQPITFASDGRSEEIDRAAAVLGFHHHAGCLPGCLWQRRSHG
jgi:anti-anti-sigma regulatory factor